MNAPANRFHGAIPILMVRSLEKSLDYYQRVLGFTVDWREPYMAQVSRNDAHIMLCVGHQGRPGTWIWIGVADAGVLHLEYRSSGAVIRLPPTNYPWAYEMHVEDPDGHVIRMGSEPLADQPFSEWVIWYQVSADDEIP